MANRKISVVLELDTGQWTGRLSSAGAQLKVFGGQITSTSNTVRQMGRSFDTLSNHLNTPLQKLRDYVLILGNLRIAMLTVRDITVGWIGGMLKQSAEVERLTMLMKGLSNATTELGKSREAEKNLTALLAMARDNGFAINQLADAFVKLKVGGIDPMNGSLQSLTDAVAKFGGGSEVMHRASIAIQQMAGKGVISMEELRQQLGEAVPTAMRDMARAAGMEMDKFVKLVSDGKVKAAPALELMFREFERLYSGAGAAKANTLLGQVDQFKNNLTVLSTAFTGMAAGQTDNLKAYMEEQQKLLDEGKISIEQFRSNTAGGGGGMFQGATDAMKQINEAMRSNEAKLFMRDVGDAINSVMKGLMSVGQFIVRWRSEIGGVLMGLAAGFATVKAIQIGQWFVQLGAQAIASARGVQQAGTAAASAQGAFGGLEARVRSMAAAQQQALVTHQARIAALGNEARMTTMLAVTKQRDIALLSQQRMQLQGTLQGLAQQRAQQVANLRTAQTLHAANIASGRSSVQSALNVKAAQDALNATRRSTITANRALAATEVQLAAAHRQGAAAAAMATASTSRLTTALAASTFAMRMKANAATLAAGAVTLLGRAMAVALGPIGMIAMALYAAASAAGVFESAANKASDAAARLMQGMASLDDMKSVQARRDSDRAQFTALTDTLNKGTETVRVRKGGGANGSFYVNEERAISPERRAQLMREREATGRRFVSDGRALRRGQFSYNNERVDSAWGRVEDGLTESSRRMGGDYANEVHRLENDKSLSASERQRRIDAAGAKLDAARASQASGAYNSLVKDRENLLKSNPKADTRGIDAMIERAKAFKDAATNAGQSTADLRGQLVGAGKDAGGKGAKGLSDAEKAAKKLATAANSAREKWANMIDQQKGEIAQLEEQEAGGDKTGTARFEALKKAGFYAHATNEQLEEMAKNFARIDQLNENISFNNTMDGLRKEVAKTAAEATELWKGLENGYRGYDAMTRDAQYRSRFAGKLEGVTDPAKIAEINAEIDKMIANIKRADAAEVTAGWLRMAEEIEISLMDENAQRQANHDAEVARQRELINLTVAGTMERRRAEEAFERWKRMADEKLRRDQEHGIVKQARQWAQLGSNIDQVLTSAFGNLVDGMMSGEMNFKKFAKDLIKQLLKIIVQAMIAYAILSALGVPMGGGGFGGFLKGQLMQGFNVRGDTQAVGTNHTGGLMGRGAMTMVADHVFKGAKTYHGGGFIGGRQLKPGEVPIIGMEDELVLTEQQQAILGGRLANGGGGQQPPVNVQIINNSGTDVDAEVDTQFDGKDMIINVVMEAAAKEGRFRNMMQGMGGKK